MATRSDKESRQQLRLKEHEPPLAWLHTSASLPSFPLPESELRLLRPSQFDLFICLKTEGYGYDWTNITGSGSSGGLSVGGCNIFFISGGRGEIKIIKFKKKRLTKGGKKIKWTQISLCKETADGRRAEKVKYLNKTARRRRGRMREDHLRMLGGK